MSGDLCALGAGNRVEREATRRRARATGRQPRGHVRQQAPRQQASQCMQQPSVQDSHNDRRIYSAPTLPKHARSHSSPESRDRPTSTSLDPCYRCGQAGRCTSGRTTPGTAQRVGEASSIEHDTRTCTTTCTVPSSGHSDDDKTKTKPINTAARYSHVPLPATASQARLIPSVSKRLAHAQGCGIRVC